MRKTRLQLLLALLIMAATGTWAQSAQTAKHRLTATYGDKMLSMDVELPYQTSLRALITAIEGAVPVPEILETTVTGVTSNNTNVEIGMADHGWEAMVTIKADCNAKVTVQMGAQSIDINFSVVPPYYVALKSGTKDAAKWTAKVGTSTTAQALPVGGLTKGQAVTLNYTGRLRVKKVTATTDATWDGDLSDIPAWALESDGKTLIVKNGMTLYGTLNVSTNPYKIQIAAGATVTFNGVTINGVHNTNYQWAGITCAGNATIILADGKTNTVKGFHNEYPGIQAGPANTTLTIKGGSAGTGSLTATSNQFGAGIGGGSAIPCGNISIQGGNVTATGGQFSAAIGGGTGATCGDISISGGTVTATGGQNAAGIGSAHYSSDDTNCGNITITGGTVVAAGGDKAAAIGCGWAGDCGAITITKGVTSVTATKGTGAPYSIGMGKGVCACGTVNIGCTLDTDGTPQGGRVCYEGTQFKNGGEEYLAQSPFIYVPTEWDGDLSNIPASALTGGNTVTVPTGMTLYGTLDVSTTPYKIQIAAGATVTLADATINGVNSYDYSWAGLTCLGDATIILADGTTNTVKGFYENYPGIYVPGDKDNPTNNKTLIIKGGTLGNGQLTAMSNRLAAGIGGGKNIYCGNILIQGGIITATGGNAAAGIGSGNYGSCGDINITGGTVTANGGHGAPGIGSGYEGSCGAINISTGVTSVTASKSSEDLGPNAIGFGNYGTCGTVTIGGTQYYNGSAYDNGGDTYLTLPTITYPNTANTVNLTNQTADYVAQEGDILTGSTSYGVTIPAGATVTLANLTISNDKYCIKCAGNATIILKDGTTNKLTCTSEDYPALWVGNTGTTLTIQGNTGKLNVTSGEFCAGIGGGSANASSTCGDIKIEGGIINAKGGDQAAGIGSDMGPATCGDIIISGGTVTATGGPDAPGIGSGNCGGFDPSDAAHCGNITITTDVTSVTATAGTGGSHSIGRGKEKDYSTCGTVTIGGTVYENGVTESPFTYPYPIALNAVTSANVGCVITTDGYVYATVDDATTAGKTAAAIIVYVGNSTDVSSPYTNGLAIALSDESSTMTWSTASTTCSDLNTSIPVANASWMLPSLNQWQTMFSANGGSNSNWSGLNTTITNAGGTTLQQNGYYWTSTDYNNNTNVAWDVYLSNSGGIVTSNSNKNDSDNSYHVRACLAF